MRCDYEPDMIVWLTTLRIIRIWVNNSTPPIVENNADTGERPDRNLFAESWMLTMPDLSNQSFLDLTIVGQRRELPIGCAYRHLIIMWSLTGVDQYYPDEYNLRSEDFEEDVSWHDLR